MLKEDIFVQDGKSLKKAYSDKDMMVRNVKTRALDSSFIVFSKSDSVFEETDIPISHDDEE